MKKSSVISLVFALILFPGPVFACEYDFDCEPGSKCVKDIGELDGYCAGGTMPGNSYDQKPYKDPADPTDSEGDTCQFDTDCGAGASCKKSSGQVYGVCAK